MAFVCEICGGTSVIKSGDVFACEVCGAKYSVADVRKMMAGSTPAPATATQTPAHAEKTPTPAPTAPPVVSPVGIETLLENGKDAIDREDWAAAGRYYLAVLEKQSSNKEAIVYSAYVNVRKSYVTFNAAYRVEALERMRRTIEQLFVGVNQYNAEKWVSFFFNVGRLINEISRLGVPEVVARVGNLSVSCSNETQCVGIVEKMKNDFVGKAADVAFSFKKGTHGYRVYLQIANTCASGEMSVGIYKLLDECAPPAKKPAPPPAPKPVQKPAPAALTKEELAWIKREEEEAAKKKPQEDFVNQKENTELPKWLQKILPAAFVLNSWGTSLFYLQDRDVFRGSSWQVVLGLSIAYGILTGLLIMAMCVFSIILGKQKDNTVLVKLSKIFAFVAAALTLVGGIVWHWLCLLSTLLLVVGIVIYFKLEKVRDWDAFMAKYKKEQSTSATPAPAPAPAASATDEPGELSLGK